MKFRSLDPRRQPVDRSLALASLQAVGKEHFAESLLQALSGGFRIGHLSMFAYLPTEGPLLLGTGSTVSPRVAYDTALIYMDSHWLSDPGRSLRQGEDGQPSNVYVQYMRPATSPTMATA